MAAALVAASAGCERARPKVASPNPGEQVVVRSFTDAASVRQLEADPPHVFAATDTGLDLWDLEKGERVAIELDGELEEGDIRALAVDAEERSLWLASGMAIGRYSLETGAWKEIPRVPLESGEAESIELAVADDDAVWVGGEFGLAYADLKGSWSITDVGSRVRALHVDAEGTLWIGTERGLIAMSSAGEILRREEGDECGVGSVRMLTASRGGGVLAVGETGAGQRIAVVDEGACQLFRASPDVRWVDVASTGDVFAVLTERRLYATAQGARGARQLDRNGMRLLALSGEGRAGAGAYRLRSIDVSLPVRGRALGIAGDQLLVGTEEVGTAQIALGSEGSLRWLRRRSLVSEEGGLSVECRAEDDCFIATGTRRMWRFDGDRVRAGAPAERAILAVVPSPEGGIYALGRGEEEGTLHLLQPGEEGWMPLEDLTIEVPGVDPEISFAKVSPSGMLWVGLKYRDEEGDLRPYGVALVDLALGVVAYHRATMDEAERDRGVLPIPVNTVDVSFAGSETWLATSEGAAAVREEGTVERYTEARGLRSELLRGVAVNPGGTVFVATRAGVGVFDGRRWQFPRALRYSVRALDFDEGGRLWMATDRGLAAYDGHRVRRLDARRGLLEDELRDLALDGYGRVWVRGAEGITVVAP